MKRQRSKYESYFEHQGEMGACRYCPAKLKWTKQSGTNSLRFHLKKQHPAQFEKLKSQEAPPVKISESSSEENGSTDSQGHSHGHEGETSEGEHDNVKSALGMIDPRERLTVPCVPFGKQNVYSCAGFVKSSSPIDFSELKVKLLTLEGHLKHEEEVNPSNGYFMIPVYNKGSYTLKVASPAGYYFEPDTIEVKIDGKTDAGTKNKDLVFKLTGFSVRGTVDGAPAGLSLVLTQNGKQVDSTKTLEGGKYEMRAPPGKYEVSTGADASECIARGKATVEVKDSPVVVTPNLKISGYQLEIATKNMEHHPFTDAVRPEHTEEDEKIMRMIVGDRLPVETVEGENFRVLLKSLKPGYTFKAIEHYVNLVLPSFRASLESRISKELKLASKISLALDLSTIGISKLHCAAIFAHWTNEATMEPTHALLEFKTFRNYEEIGPQFFDSIISKFGISGKIVGIIDENDFKLSDDTVPRLPNLQKILDKVPRILYSNHLDLFSKQRSMILEFRRLQHVYGWNSCYKELLNIEFADLEMLMESLANPDTMEWNDHLELLYFVHDVQVPRILTDFYGKTKEKRNCQEMTTDDMIISEFVYKILKIVRKVVDCIRNKSYPSASNIIPIIREMLNKAQQLDTSSPLYDALSMMKAALIKHLQIVYDSCQKNEVLRTATFLDGRFRDRYFSKSHKDYMISKYRKFAGEVIMSELDEIKKEDGNSTNASAQEGQLEIEIAKYLQQDPNYHSNPIEFWKQNEAKFPILKRLATQFLSIRFLEIMKAKEIYEFGEKIVPVYHMESVKEVFGYCAAIIEIEKLTKNSRNF
ncbi:unnamed protein product [Caenorhabditis nigoni]